MKKFFDQLTEKDPELVLNIKKALEDQIKYFGKALEYDLTTKDREEIEKFLDTTNSILDVIEPINIQLRLKEFELSKIVTNKVTLDHDFTYTKPEGYRLYRGEIVTISSYYDLYVSLCEYFYKLNPVIFRSFPQKTDFNGWKRTYFSLEKNKIRNAVLIGNSVYIETKFPANKIRDILIKMFSAYNLSFDILEIYIRQDRKEEHRYYEK